MYNLGEHFNMDYTKAKPNEKSIIAGETYRFTVLSERLIRLEYNEKGIFEDRPTELAWYRDFDVPEFTTATSGNKLTIQTSYFKLTYHMNKKFEGTKLNPTTNLQIQLLNTDRVWYYNHPEIRNVGAPSAYLTDQNGKAKFRKGLYSLDGFASIDDSKNNIIEQTGTLIAREEGTIDIYVFLYLKDFANCLKDYFTLTGYPSLIPRYALGNWWNRNIAYNDETLGTLVHQFEEREIPLSVMLLNRDWHIRSFQTERELKTGFTFNKDFFKSPYEMIDALHSKGIRLGLNINPFGGIYPFEEYYKQATEYITPDEKGVIPFHVMNPKILDVYLKLLIHPLDALGVDFFWIDENDLSKLNHIWALNHYHFFDMKRNYKRRPMVLGKNAYVAAHRYPVLYSGKHVVGWDILKLVPFHNLSASNIGVSWWAHDIGGYYKGMEDDELYTRYVQLGTFSPILKLGADKGKYYKREPWRWDVKTYEISKDYLTLRHKLIPYLYAEAYKYHKYGVPLVQPLYYKFPDIYDDIIYKNQYFFGSEMMVAPIISKKEPVMNRVIHRMFIPDGIWFDFFTGKKFPGGKNYVSFYKDEDYPVFAKAGAIIPFGYNDNLNDTTPPKHMEIHIFPGVSNHYQLYEDDGVSDLYRKDYYLMTSIEYNYLPNNYTVIVRATSGKTGIVPALRNYQLWFRNTKATHDVIVYFNDQQISCTKKIDGNDFVVEIRDVPTNGQLTVNCRGTDIEIDAVRVINEDIESILSDLPLSTELKETIDHIIFGQETIQKKRIAIRKLGNKEFEKKFVNLFLKLLEYVGGV